MYAKLIRLASTLLCTALVMPSIVLSPARASEQESASIDQLIVDKPLTEQFVETTDYPPPTVQLESALEPATKSAADEIGSLLAQPCEETLCLSSVESLDAEISQAPLSQEQILEIQESLRNLEPSETPQRRRRRSYPGITISNPTGYGADRGRVFAGVGFQSRTRYSGGRNVGTIFGGGTQDATAGVGFGIGDARKSVGLQLSYTAASFGNSREPFSGGFNAKVHKRFGDRLSVALGGEGIINFGRLAENDDAIEFNDFENTYYGSATYTVNLREDFNKPLSRLLLTGGAGTGRFRSVDQAARGDFAVGVFGSAALQVYPWATVITEWTGQDLAAGVSIAPFENIPVVITPAVRDIAGEGDGDPRFVVGVGVSISDLFSSQ